MSKPEPNPWGLTAREAEVMTTLLQQGSHKLTAWALKLSVKTVQAHVCAAAQKMPQRTPLLRCLAWQRWLTEGNAGPDAAREAPEPEPYYVGGPYHDGSYALCETDTGRVVYRHHPAAPDAQPVRFDASTKVCTMNCGPSRDDPRTAAERKLLCCDCVEMNR